MGGSVVGSLTGTVKLRRSAGGQSVDRTGERRSAGSTPAADLTTRHPDAKYHGLSVPALGHRSLSFHLR